MKKPPPTKKLKFIMLEDKAAIIAEVEKGRKKMDIADEFGVVCSSLSTTIKNKAFPLGALENCASAKSKTVTAAAFPDVDKVVFAWFCEQRANKVPLSGRIKQQKELDFTCMLGHDNFKASPGWLSHFKACHGIVASHLQGGSSHRLSDNIVLFCNQQPFTRAVATNTGPGQPIELALSCLEADTSLEITRGTLDMLQKL
ncbi:hypothetical protein HPB50_001018 [Hyalomma asiaticum]|uniref:Uncharacterized protein n=1 Tax=Hyalomma asiaticum TaxID=266040 RepID=A0ACB7RTH6_HYAAI|nr:hypothetical protein HPB50_001018 [Hyalomma asiaticum]